MHIQINTVTRTICNCYLFASCVHLPLPRLSVYPLKVAFGHTCKISHCCHIVCPLHILHKSFLGKKKTKQNKNTTNHHLGSFYKQNFVCCTNSKQ